jgi:hypothetical protein
MATLEEINAEIARRRGVDPSRLSSGRGNKFDNPPQAPATPQEAALNATAPTNEEQDAAIIANPDEALGREDFAPSSDAIQAELARREAARRQKVPLPGGEEDTFGDDLWRHTKGMIGVINTVASSAIAEPLAGWSGIFRLLANGSMDQAANDIRAAQDAMTWTPSSEEGKQMLENVAAPLKKLDDSADWLATAVSFGNPYAEATIYSTLVGGLSVAGMRGGSRIKVNQRVAEVEKIAKDLGINTKPEKLGASVIEAAERMTPNQRAANAGDLRDALRVADEVENARVAGLRKRAAETETFVSVEEAAKFAAKSSKELLEEGFDIAEMPVLRKRMQEIAKLERRTTEAQADAFVNTAQQRASREGLTRAQQRHMDSIVPQSTARSTPLAPLQSVEVIRRRIEKTLLSRKDRTNLPATTRESLALTSLENKLGTWLDNQFNADMISGSPEGIARWKEFNAASQSYRARFNADRTLTQLMDMAASPEQISQFLIGTSAVSKPQAGAVIRRLKDVLGENHPAIKGIQQDYLYNVAAPLLQSTPDFKAFIHNYDTAIRGNASLVKQLGLKESNLGDLRRFAATAAEIPGGVGGAIVPDFHRAFSQFFAGNKLAKASLRVQLFTNVLKLITGKKRITQKRILADLAEAQFDGPALSKGSVASGRIIQAAVLADIVGADRKARER